MIALPSLFGSLWRLERRVKLALMLGLLALLELAWRGVGLLIAAKVDPYELQDRLAALPTGMKEQWAALSLYLAWIEPAALLLVGAYGGVLGGMQLWWRLKTWPQATARTAQPGHLLEILLPPDQSMRWRAMAGLLEQLFGLLQADVAAVRRGEALNISLEYWSGLAGTGLYCWLPASADERLIGAFAAQLRAAYPGARVRRSSCPLRAVLHPDGDKRNEAILGIQEYGLRAHSDWPLRDPETFPFDPLGALVAALQASASTPLVGLQIVLTAYNGSWRDGVGRHLETVRARELQVQRKAALPATHAAELRALGRQSDQLGFDTLVRAVVVGAGARSGAVVQGTLARITRQLAQYDAVVGKIRQGLEPMRGGAQQDALPASGELVDWMRAALDRLPRPLAPIGRRLHVLGARELALLWHPPAKELARLPGLSCWQRAQVFPAPGGARVPGGEAARDWMITGIVPAELGAIDGRPEYVGVRRAALNQHVYVLGPTRSGKTKLLENMTRQDLDEGLGVGVIDPKGDYARKSILMVPWEREGEVCYFDPLDSSRRIMGVNPLERAAVEKLGRDLVQSGAIGILGSLGAGWEQAPLGKRFMQHALALLLDAEPGPTFLHLYRLLQHSKEGNPYRDELLSRANPQTAQNYSVVAADFWANQVPGMKESQLGSLQTALTRTESFLSNERVLQIVAQPASTFSLRRMMDQQGIFVAAVTAELGGDLQKFVGTLLMTMITQAGFSRNDLAEGKRPFWRLTVDEFQKFIAMSGSAESFEDLLSMLGGLGVGLTMAHQARKQLSPDLLGIILGNVGTRIFYPSQEDAAAIAASLGAGVRKEDLLYLERFWTTQALPMASGSSGPVTVAPLPIALLAATPPDVRDVSALALADPQVSRWGRACVAPDELQSGLLRDLTTARPDEDEGQQQARLAKLVQLFYGAERDERVVETLCSLSAPDFPVYSRLRRQADRRFRNQVLAYRRLCGDDLSEEAKLRRIALLSDLEYGTPPVEVRAQIRRVMGQQAGQLDAEKTFDGTTASGAVASVGEKQDERQGELQATAATFEEIATDTVGADSIDAGSEQAAPEATPVLQRKADTAPLPYLPVEVVADAGHDATAEPSRPIATLPLATEEQQETAPEDEIDTAHWPGDRSTAPLRDEASLPATVEKVPVPSHQLQGQQDTAPTGQVVSFDEIDLEIDLEVASALLGEHVGNIGSQSA